MSVGLGCPVLVARRRSEVFRSFVYLALRLCGAT